MLAIDISHICQRWRCGVCCFSRKYVEKLKWKLLSLTECEQLIRGMLLVNANRRLSLQQVCDHAWVKKGGPDENFEKLIEECKTTEELNKVEPLNEMILNEMGAVGIDKERVRNVSAKFMGSYTGKLLPSKHPLKFWNFAFSVQLTNLPLTCIVMCAYLPFLPSALLLRYRIFESLLLPLLQCVFHDP